MVMYNPQDGMYYDVPMQSGQAQTPSIYRNPMAGVYGQGLPHAAIPQPATPMAQPAAPRGQQLTARPAANISEVQATMIDLGTVNLFYNQHAGEIYLSRYTNDGAKEIKVFTEKVEEVPQEASAATIQPTAPSAPPVDLSGVYERLDELKTMITGGLENGYEHEPAPNVASAQGRHQPAAANQFPAPASPAAGGEQPASKADVGHGAGKK